VLLHAHSHKQSASAHRITGRKLFEIGALCDTPDYALKGGKHTYSPTS
jgi:hypothetical protein